MPSDEEVRSLARAVASAPDDAEAAIAYEEARAANDPTLVPRRSEFEGHLRSLVTHVNFKRRTRLLSEGLGEFARALRAVVPGSGLRFKYVNTGFARDSADGPRGATSFVLAVADDDDGHVTVGAARSGSEALWHRDRDQGPTPSSCQWDGPGFSLMDFFGAKDGFGHGEDPDGIPRRRGRSEGWAKAGPLRDWARVPFAGDGLVLAVAPKKIPGRAARRGDRVRATVALVDSWLRARRFGIDHVSFRAAREHGIEIAPEW